MLDERRLEELDKKFVFEGPSVLRTISPVTGYCIFYIKNAMNVIMLSLLRIKFLTFHDKCAIGCKLKPSYNSYLLPS